VLRGLNEAMNPSVLHVKNTTHNATHLAAGGTYVGAQPVRGTLRAGTCSPCKLSPSRQHIRDVAGP